MTDKRVVCRVFEAIDFREFLEDLYEGEPVYIDLDYEGICISIGEDEECPYDLHDRIAEALGVKEVTSIHLDDLVPPNVWLAVKED